MGRQDLLSDDERRRLFGLPESEAELIRYYTLSLADLDLVAERHGARNRLGFAVQLCLLRHPGFGLRSGEQVPEPLLDYLAHQLGVPGAAFQDYSRRAQTRLDHASEIAALLGLRAFTRADLPLALELRHAGDHGRQHAASRCRQVEGQPVQRDHRHAPSLQVLQRVQEVARAAAPARGGF